jgi:hypothetical protein
MGLCLPQLLMPPVPSFVVVGADALLLLPLLLLFLFLFLFSFLFLFLFLFLFFLMSLLPLFLLLMLSLLLVFKCSSADRAWSLVTLLAGDGWGGDPAEGEEWVDADGGDAACDVDSGAEAAVFPIVGLLPGDLDAP